MKLIGIERTDLDKAKKVLAMLHKLQTISNEFEESSIKVYNANGNEVEDCSYNKSKNIDDNETISRLNKDYNETAWSYYIGDYDRFKYLLDKAKN